MSGDNIVADDRESAANALVDDSTVVIAHPMGDQRAPLGLDRPLQLRGDRSRMVPSGMPSALGIDHIPALRSFVADACRRRLLVGRHGYHQPPLALVGQKGVGKGFASLWIARNAGVPLFRMPVEDSFPGNRMITGTARSMPLPPVIAMAATLCANPVIVIELDVKRRISAPRTHQAWWTGKEPREVDGRPLDGMRTHGTTTRCLEGLPPAIMLCCKPRGREFRDHHEFVTTYVSLLPVAMRG